MSIEVMPGQVMRAESDTLVAKDIYTYLALAVRIKLGRNNFIGYLGYFDPEASLETRLDEMLEHAVDEARDAEHIVAWPAGCAPFKPPNPQVATTKEIVAAALNRHNITVARPLWIPIDTIFISSLRLNCDNGTVNAYNKSIV